MTVLSVEGQKYYSEDIVVEKRGDLFANGKPRSIFLNKKVEIDKEKDCRFFYLKEDKWVVTTHKYSKAVVFFSEAWLKKIKIEVKEDTEMEDIKPEMERIGVTAGAKVEENIEVVFEKLKKECNDTITDSDKGLFKAYRLGDSHYITDYFDFKNVILDKNGYFNATKLCWKGAREYRDWIKTTQAKDMVKKMDVMLRNLHGTNKPTYAELSTKFNNVIKGTYLHPDLVVHLATWISFEFYVFVLRIVNEWRRVTYENSERFFNGMGVCFEETKKRKAYEKLVKICEQKYQEDIAEKENGDMEVEVEAGYIDVLTKDKIIEVKNISKWKFAIGQVQSYSVCLEENGCSPREKWIYLFSKNNERVNRNLIVKVCKKLNIHVKFIESIEIEAKIKQMKLDNMNIKEELSKSEIARQKAEEEYAKAEEERQKAEAARQEEKLARQRAEEEYSKAEVARKESEKQRTAAMVILNRLEIKLTDVETTLDEQVDVTTQIKNVLEDTVDRNVPKNSNHAKKYENLYLVRKNQRHFYKLHRVQNIVEIPLEKGEEIICTVKDTPNSVNLGNAIKQRLLDLIPNIRIKNSIIDTSDVEYSSIENLENILKNTCLSEHEKRVTTPLNKIPIAIDKRKKTRY